MKTRKFFAIGNHYGNSTSHGFANTYYCLVFNNQSDRAAWVSSSESLSAQAIKKSEIGQYLERPKPFSGMAFMIAALGEECEIPGCDGTVIVDYPGNTTNAYLFD